MARQATTATAHASKSEDNVSEEITSKKPGPQRQNGFQESDTSGNESKTNVGTRRNLKLSKEEKERNRQRQIDQGRRLKQARVSAGFRSATNAATFLDIANPTYLSHENGSRQIREDLAEEYAEKFNVSAEWLLYGTEDAGQAGNVASPRPSRSDPLLASISNLYDRLNVRYCRDTSRLVKKVPDIDAVPLPDFDGEVNFVPVLDVCEACNMDEPKVFFEVESGRVEFVVKNICPVNIRLWQGKPERIFAIHSIPESQFLSNGKRVKNLLFKPDTSKVPGAISFGLTLSEGRLDIVEWRCDRDKKQHIKLVPSASAEDELDCSADGYVLVGEYLEPEPAMIDLEPSARQRARW